MNEGEGESGEAATHLSAASTLTASGAEFESSTSVGNQTWSVEYGQWELELAKATHKQKQEEAQLKHDLEQAEKDNNARRFKENISYCVIVGIIVIGLVVSWAVAIFNGDAANREFARNIVTILIGGVIGGLAGYFTAKSGR